MPHKPQPQRVLTRGAGRLRLAPLRPSRPPDSTRLDGLAVKQRGEEDPTQIPPFLAWTLYERYLYDEWRAGQHVAIVGMNGSGKTVFARQLLRYRDFVLVFATKAVDDSLYRPLEKEGFVVRETWTPWDWEDTGERKVILRPMAPGQRPTKDVLANQAAVFREALLDIFVAGSWCCYFDEVRYLSDNLNLRAELDLLWLQGRSNHVSMVASTQRPVSVPINMFEQATWIMTWRVSDRDDRSRTAEYTGDLAPVVRATAGRLPQHEFLSIQKYADRAVRSKVDLARATS